MTMGGAELRERLIDAGLLQPRGEVTPRAQLPADVPVLRIDAAGQAAAAVRVAKARAGAWDELKGYGRR